MPTNHHPVDPQAYTKILGSTFSKAEHRALITIGNRSWSKWDLGRLGCPHPAAATRVSRLIRQLEIRTVKEFLDRAHEFGGYKSLGVTCYWTVLALAKDLGAEIEAVHGSDQSFHTIHSNALKAEQTPKPKRRKGRRI